jgi:hypothetical protein
LKNGGFLRDQRVIKQFHFDAPNWSLGRIQSLRAAQRSSRGGNGGFRGSFAVEFQQLPEPRQEWTNSVFGALAKYKSGGIMALTSALA